MFDPKMLSSCAKTLMKHVKMAHSAEDLILQRLSGPKNRRNITDPTERAPSRGADILKALTKYFRNEKYTARRLAIEEQASELGNVQK